jgi:2-polyprenyl-6-methoxyphenol hydroxylase-like FAD-dependent oxidoreductase
MAALLLSRRGWQVTLIEQSRYPRQKVCGECVSALGMAVLERAGLKDCFLEAGAVRLTRALLHPPAGRAATMPLPAPMWGLSRGAMDLMLLRAAGSAGAAIRQPARCESLGTTGAFDPTLRIRDLTHNTVEDLAPAWALVADGKAALCGPAGRPPTATGDFGIKAHFELVAGPRDAIELFSTVGTYGGLAAIEDGRWNAAFSVPARMLREHRGDIAALFARLVDSNPTLGTRLANARRIGPWLAAPLPRFAVARKWPRHVIPIGNAAAALEPIGGEGMGLAMRSAELAALALVDPAGFQPAVLSRAYRRLWAPRRAGCRAAAKVISFPKGASMAANLVRRHNWLENGVLRLLGKASNEVRQLPRSIGS